MVTKFLFWINAIYVPLGVWMHFYFPPYSLWWPVTNLVAMIGLSIVIDIEKE